MSNTYLKDIQKTFVQLGFQKFKNSSIFVGTEDNLVKFLFTRKSRVDNSIQLIAGIWCEYFRHNGYSIVDELKSSVITPDISLAGIGLNKWWHLDESFDAELFRETVWKVAVPFLRSVRTVEQIGHLLEEEGQESMVSGCFPQLSEELPFLPEVSFTEIPLTDAAEFRNVVKQVVRSLFLDAGFVFKATDRQVVGIRPRGDFIDVIEFRRSKFGMFASIHCYVMHRAIWRVQKQLKGLYIKGNGGLVGNGGLSKGLSCFRIDDLRAMSRSLSDLIRA
ncbi:MAG: hypothetical protein ABG776_09755, partial [Cyanobacteria bacterium J06555_13]